MDVNRHMNLFEHYRQEGEAPHENNLSRGLAILLGENPLLLERFIDLANSKLLALGKAPIRKPMASSAPSGPRGEGNVPATGGSALSAKPFSLINSVYFRIIYKEALYSFIFQCISLFQKDRKSHV